jgi:hypothetical protein
VKKMALHTCKLASGFFYSRKKRKENDITFVGLQVVFPTHIGEKNK